MQPKVCRLEQFGPEGQGLAPMSLDPKDFQSSLPEQNIHVYFEDPEIGLTVGVWTTTDMQEAFGPYPGDEFMVVLEGRVEMHDADGHHTTIETGQSFIIKNAIPISWKQKGFMRKFFILLHDPDKEPPKIDTAHGGVIVLDEAALADAFQSEPESIGGGHQNDSPVFTNQAGTMSAGLWDSTAFESEMSAFSIHEFCQILEGEVTITEPNGVAQTFGAGEVLFVPKGTVCSWKSEGYVRKYYVSVEG